MDTTLSRRGSTRATAYAMSNKIVTRGDHTHVAWLDHVAHIRICSLDRKTSSWGPIQTVGTGVDNHSGPALAADADGFLHIVFGPHHGPFAYRSSLRPNDSSAWGEARFFSDNATYPSLVAAPDGSLFLACRVSREKQPWQLHFHRKAPGADWSDGKVLLDVGVNDYAWLGNSLAIDGIGRLHLAFCIYDMHPAGGKRFGYLVSTDCGQSWSALPGGPTLPLPVTRDTTCWIEAGPDLDVRAAGMVTDPGNNPWFAVTRLERSPRTVELFTLRHGRWESIDLLPHLQPEFPETELVDASLAFDHRGNLHVAATMGPRTVGNQYWAHPEQEVVHLFSSDNSNSFQVQQVSEPDPGLPAWLPNFERSVDGRLPDAPLGLLYTRGGPGEGCTGGPATEVCFCQLD